MLMEVTSQYHGEIRQLITDDKGTVMILLFGLIAHANNPVRHGMAWHGTTRTAAGRQRLSVQRMDGRDASVCRETRMSTS